MKIKGKIIEVFPKIEGVSKTGQRFATMDFVIQSEESTPQYPNYIVFQIYGEDKINKFSFGIGDYVTVSFNINSRKVGNKYFTNISAWGVYGEQKGNNNSQYSRNEQHSSSAGEDKVGAKYEDLPF